VNLNTSFSMYFMANCPIYLKQLSKYNFHMRRYTFSDIFYWKIKYSGPNFAKHFLPSIFKTTKWKICFCCLEKGLILLAAQVKWTEICVGHILRVE
jgi:hypothetical protein